VVVQGGHERRVEPLRVLGLVVDVLGPGWIHALLRAQAAPLSPDLVEPLACPWCGRMRKADLIDGHLPAAAARQAYVRRH
jgi:hypothetical protein